MNRLNKWAIGLLATVLSSPAFAGSTGQTTELPWDTVFNKVLGNLSGPVAKSLILIGIIWAGYQLLFGDLSSGGRKAFSLALGACLIMGAVSIFNSLFNGLGAVI